MQYQRIRYLINQHAVLTKLHNLVGLDLKYIYNQLLENYNFGYLETGNLGQFNLFVIIITLIRVKLLELEVVSTRREIIISLSEAPVMLIFSRRLPALFYNTPGLRRTLLHVLYNTVY
jgi:hypothetical protein